MDPTPSGDAPLSLKSAQIALAMEKTVLPWVFAYLAYQRLNAALHVFPGAQ